MKKFTTVLLAAMAATGMGLVVAGDGHTTQIKGGQFAPLGDTGANMPMAAGCRPGTAGIVIHDDGEAENGYGWNASIVLEGRFAEPFEAAAYPATIASVCYSFITNEGITEFDFDIVVWDSDGPGGTPGTMLGSMSAVGHPEPIAGLPLTASFEEYDLSPLNLDITGPVFIGLQWNPQDVGNGLFISADESAATPSNNGYLWSETTDTSGPWAPIGDHQAGYRALMVRAVMPEVQAEPPEPVTPVSIPSSGPWALLLLMLGLGGLALRLGRQRLV